MIASGRRQALDRGQLAKNAEWMTRRSQLPESLIKLLQTAARIAALVPPFAAAAHAQAQPASTPTSATSGASSEQTEAQQDIVVVADRTQQNSIDRTTYIVKDNAEARASTALDLLGRVPSVDVSPSGHVRLIGRSGVTVQVDGQAVPNASDLLRAMQGSQVAKIEVVTNPSAQITARGTGGIINIITRRSSPAGLDGSITSSAGSFGSYEGRVSPSWSSGKLSLNGSIGVRREGSKNESEEDRIGAEPGTNTDRTELQSSQGDTDTLSANLRASLEVAPKQAISLSAMAVETDGRTSAQSEIISNGSPSEERSRSNTNARMQRIAADYRREGSRPGQQTSISASHTSFRLGVSRRFLTSATEGSSLFQLRSDLTGNDTVLKFDHVRPAGNRRLTIGGQFQRNAEDNRQQVNTISAPADPTAPEESFEGSWSEAAAYVTYQFPFLGNQVLAGTRVESRWHNIADAADDPAGSTHIFPSLHLERKLGERLTAILSYSSRIGWPNIALLDPRLRFSDPATARAGNPLLRPEKTHSLELKLMAKARRHEADVTSYYQQTRDVRSEVVELEGDVLVSRPVNLGRRRSYGSNLNLRGPLATGLRYTVTADLAHETIEDTDLPGVDDSGVRYGVSFQLEFRDGIEGRAGADQIRLTARYSGPSEAGLSRISSTVRADASWSHAMSDRLSAVLTASHAFKSMRISTFGPDVVSRTSVRAAGPTFSFALTYALSPSAQ